MSILQAIILGLVQGIAEFLPISSSGHLVLLQNIFGFQEATLTFDIVLHLGTLTALLLFFWRDWIKIIKSFFTSIRKWNLKNDAEQRLAWFLIIATIPGAVFGFFLEEKIETILRNTLVVAVALAGLGSLLLLAERAAKKRKELDQMKWWESVLIGLSQAVALVPGVSRSGVTITTGLFLGLKREAAARFSFLLSTPIIFGAGISSFRKILEDGNGNGGYLTYAIGFAISAISGYLAIKYLLKYVEKHSLDIFAYYRFLLAGAIIIYLLVK